MGVLRAYTGAIGCIGLRLFLMDGKELIWLQFLQSRVVNLVDHAYVIIGPLTLREHMHQHIFSLQPIRQLNEAERRTKVQRP